MDNNSTKSKEDFSLICNGNDEDLNNPCWECVHFVFPIGCMKNEEDYKES